MSTWIKPRRRIRAGDAIDPDALNDSVRPYYEQGAWGEHHWSSNMSINPESDTALDEDIAFGYGSSGPSGTDAEARLQEYIEVNDANYTTSGQRIDRYGIWTDLDDTDLRIVSEGAWYQVWTAVAYRMIPQEAKLNRYFSSYRWGIALDGTLIRDGAIGGFDLNQAPNSEIGLFNRGGAAVICTLIYIPPGEHTLRTQVCVVHRPDTEIYEDAKRIGTPNILWPLDHSSGNGTNIRNATLDVSYATLAAWELAR